jgi:hypothetical protein
MKCLLMEKVNFVNKHGAYEGRQRLAMELDYLNSGVYKSVCYFRGAYRSLVGRPEGRRPLGGPRGRWEDNIKMDLQEVGWAWAGFELAQDRDRWLAVVDAVMNLRVP